MKRFLILIFAILFFLPLVVAQDAPKPKFGVVGLSLDTTSEKSLAGWGAVGIGLTNDIISYTDFDVAVVRGTTLGQLLNSEGLQYTMRTGFAYRLPLGLPEKISVWGLGDAGIAAGGLAGAEDQTIVLGSFAGGGFVHYAISDKIGVLVILQVDKNSQTGRSFIPRAGVKIKL
jgi:hypothetical protein